MNAYYNKLRHLGLRVEFLSLGAVGILGRMILHCEGCSVQSIIFSSILGLYLTDASSKFHSLSCDNRNVSRHYQRSPEGQTHLLLRTV